MLDVASRTQAYAVTTKDGTPGDQQPRSMTQITLRENLPESQDDGSVDVTWVA